MMNKQKGNMYGWITHTWNPIKGKCPHDCSYCYMKQFPQKELRLDEKALTDDLGRGNFIFVGSSTDMFAKEVPHDWIRKVLDHCNKFDNKYLFQTKNPERFNDFLFSKNVTYGTTIETNRHWTILKKITKAPNIHYRAEALKPFERTLVSIEPIMDFDLGILIEIIKFIYPTFVSIGADSKGHNLPEPSKEKIEALIKELKKFTEVKLKDNLKRLL